MSHGPVREQYRARMNKLARSIDRDLNGPRRPGREHRLGFVLLVAEFGKIEDGRVNYISNGERESMIAMLREYLAGLEGRYSDAGGRA